MRLGQIRWNNTTTAAVFEGNGLARPIPDYTVYDLIRLSEMEGVPIAKVAGRLVSAHGEEATPIIPLHPREVWACGCTYEMSASFRDDEHGTREGFYAYVYNREARPEIFFKGTARFCVGPNQAIGIRSDSKFTAPEPELAVVLAANGQIVGFTLANDVSAWDIERENPLYLPQSKMYTACCALGPLIVTPDEIDPYNLQIGCTIKRGETLIFSGSVSTSQLNRKIEQLTEYLLRANPVPGGSVLLTGTGIIVTEDSALQPGDVTSIFTPQIGELVNSAAVIS